MPAFKIATRPSLALAGLLLVVTLPPGASAACGGGVASFCVGDASAPTSAGGTFRATWLFPATVDTPSQFFIATVDLDTTASGQTLVLPTADTWNYQGCRFVSETVGGVSGVVKTANAKIQMAGQHCLVWFAVSTTNTVGGATTSTLSISMQVEARTIPTYLCGSPSPNGTCQPLSHESTGQRQATTYLLAAGWLIALLVCLSRGKVFAGGASTLGLLVTFIPVGTSFTQVAAIFLFAVACWLEAIAGQKIYARFFAQKGAGGKDHV